MNPIVSIVAKINVLGNSITGNEQLSNVLTEITTGKHKVKIEKIRDLIKEGKNDIAENIKKTLPAFIPTGKYIGSHREKDLSEFSGVINLDFDKIDSESFDHIFIKACQMNTTLSCFRSPSGNGLKILVPISTGQENFECAFNQVAEFYVAELGIEIDMHGKNISRLCFYSHDPNLYKNLDCDIFQIHHCDDFIRYECDYQEPSEININEGEILNLFEKAEIHTNRIVIYKEGNRNNFVFTLACNCCRSNIPLKEAQKLVLRKYGYKRSEVKTTVESAYRNELDKKSKSSKGSLFSMHLLNLMKYRADVGLEERVMFEAFLIKMLTFNGAFYLTTKMIEQELGIKRSRSRRIINWFIALKFISKRKVTYHLNNEPRQKNFYEVIPENIIETSKLMFNDNKEFVRRVSPLLIGYLETK